MPLPPTHGLGIFYVVVVSLQEFAPVSVKYCSHFNVTPCETSLSGLLFNTSWPALTFFFFDMSAQEGEGEFELVTSALLGMVLAD
jgi:hypothetical protein